MAALKLKVGDDNTVRFTITDDDGAVVNLTGGTIKFKIAAGINVSDANAIYLDSYTNFTQPTLGIHDEVIPDLTSKLWTPSGTGPKFQARFIDSAGVVQSGDVDSCILQQNLLDDE